jgi:hypothetical protein
MTFLRFLLMIVALFSLASTVFAADITGTWDFKVVLDAGSGEPTFVLAQQGETLSGTYKGALGEAKVRGTVKGDDVEIMFDAQDEVIRYVGKLSGADSMKGSVTYGSQASGTFTAEKRKK